MSPGAVLKQREENEARLLAERAHILEEFERLDKIRGDREMQREKDIKDRLKECDLYVTFISTRGSQQFILYNF